MGNYISSTSKADYELKISKLELKLNNNNKTNNRANRTIKKLKSEIRGLNEQVDIMDKLNKMKTKKLKHYNYILNTPQVITEAIIASDLNCIWMDDIKEREYINKIIKFIYNVCIGNIVIELPNDNLYIDK